MNNTEEIMLGKYDESAIFQYWRIESIWHDSSEKHYELCSYKKRLLKNGKHSNKNFKTVYLPYSRLEKCSMCGFISVARRFHKSYICEILKTDKYVFEIELKGTFCGKCDYQVQALNDCLQLIKNIKKEIKNASANTKNNTNTNGRTASAVSLQHADRN